MLINLHVCVTTMVKDESMKGAWVRLGRVLRGEWERRNNVIIFLIK